MRYKRLASLLALLPLLASCRVDSSSSSLESSESLPSSSVEETVPSSSSEAPAPSSSSEASPSSDSQSASPSSEAQSSDAHSSEGQNSETPHEHTYSDAWSSDSTDHWHASTCGHAEEIKDKAPHTFTDWAYEDMTDAGTQKKERHCSLCQKKEEKTIDYLADEDLLIKILSSVYENSTFTATNGSSEIKTVVTDRGAREVQKYNGQTYEYVAEFLNDRYIVYAHSEKLNLWEKSIVVLASEIEDLPEGEDCRSYFLASMWIDISTPLAEVLDEVSYDKEKGAFVISALNFSYDTGFTTVSVNCTNVEIKVDEEKLVSIEYDANGGHMVHDQIGTSSIDFSFKDSVHTHTFSSAWESDSYGHWHPLTCEHKGKERDLVSGWSTNGFDYDRHTFSSESGKCTICGYECEHRYDSNYDCDRCGYHHEHTQGDGEYHSYDEGGHCKKYGCGHPIEGTMESHNFVDCVCTVCNHAQHTYVPFYSYDSQYHWQEMSCSHYDAATAENATKEEHDYEKFGDYCPTCHYLNASTDASEKVTETQFESALSELDLTNPNLTMYSGRTFSRESIHKFKLKGDYIYSELGGYGYLRSYEGEKTYDFLTYTERSGKVTYKVEDYGSSINRDDAFIGKDRTVLLETLKKAKFADAEWNSDGYYLVSVKDDDEEEPTIKFTVKFRNGKLDLVAYEFDYQPPLVIGRSVYFAFFYDFGSTEIDVPSDCKTYDFADKYVPADEKHYHRPVFTCDGVETTISWLLFSCTYELNDDGDYACVYCGEACEHNFAFSTECYYCPSLHAHTPGEDDVCTICGQNVTDELIIEDAFTYLKYGHCDSFTCETKIYEKGADGEFTIKSSDVWKSTRKAVTGLDENLKDFYFVLEPQEWDEYSGEETWHLYEQSNEDGNLVWKKWNGEFHNVYEEELSDFVSLFYSESFEKSKTEGNTYVRSENEEDFSREYSMVIVDGVLISCTVVTISTEEIKDENGETTTATIKETKVYSDFNSTVVTLPDFGL